MKTYQKFIIAACAAVIVQAVVTEIYYEIKDRIEDHQKEMKHQLWMVAADRADVIVTKMIEDGSLERSYDIMTAFDDQLEIELKNLHYYEQ